MYVHDVQYSLFSPYLFIPCLHALSVSNCHPQSHCCVRHVRFASCFFSSFPFVVLKYMHIPCLFISLTKTYHTDYCCHRHLSMQSYEYPCSVSIIRSYAHCASTAIRHVHEMQMLFFTFFPSSHFLLHCIFLILQSPVSSFHCSDPCLSQVSICSSKTCRYSVSSSPSYRQADTYSCVHRPSCIQ